MLSPIRKFFFATTTIMLMGASQLASANTLATFSQHDEAATAKVDHRPMDQIIGLIKVEERKREKIAFSRLQGRALDYLKAYIQVLEAVPVSRLNRDEQLAYWLNLHNAAVLRLVAEKRNGYKKVKGYRGTPSDPGSEWLEQNITVEGIALSLQDIEQGVILANWQNPLTIYGLYYGVQGSPDLQAYSGQNVNSVLESNAKKFINSEKNVKAKRKGLEVSSLYEWHKPTVFAGSEEQLTSHLRSFADPKLARAIDANPTVSKHRYNWKSVAYIPRAAPIDLGGGGGGYRGVGS